MTQSQWSAIITLVMDSVLLKQREERLERSRCPWWRYHKWEPSRVSCDFFPSLLEAGQRRSMIWSKCGYLRRSRRISSREQEEFKGRALVRWGFAWRLRLDLEGAGIWVDRPSLRPLRVFVFLYWVFVFFELCDLGKRMWLTIVWTHWEVSSPSRVTPTKTKDAASIPQSQEESCTNKSKGVYQRACHELQWTHGASTRRKNCSTRRKNLQGVEGAEWEIFAGLFCSLEDWLRKRWGRSARASSSAARCTDIARWGVSVSERNADNVLRDLSHASAWGQCVTVHSDNK